MQTFYAAMIDDTKYINKEALTKGYKHVKPSDIHKVYEVIIFTLDERVHLASLTPSTYTMALSYIIEGDFDYDNEKINEEVYDMADDLMRETDIGNYMDYRDAESLVKRGENMVGAAPMVRNIGEFEDIDEAYEYARGNSPF
jgi:hypothetical protein